MIDDLKPYRAMKDSGVPWLGEVPEHWGSRKVKQLARPGYKTFVDGDWIESPYITGEGIRLIQTGNIGVGIYREKGFRYISPATFEAFGCTEFQPNDVLICRLGEPVGRACLAPDLGVRMITSVDVCILKARSDALPAFLVYAMSSPQYLDWVNSLVRGSTRDRVSRSMLGGFVLPLPPLPEQAAIVRFLDHADRRIRRYIRAKQKLIKLVEEQKQAIIHRAVTRGLDPNVRLKPSGVEWLEDVPEHWEVRRLHQITDPERPVMYGIVLPGPDVEEGVYIVKGGNCEPGKLRPELLSRTTFQIESRYVRSRLKANDIVFAIRGGVGAAELVPPELAGANITQDAARIAAGGGIDPGWLLHAVSAPIFREHVKSQVVGATVRGINIRSLKRIEVVVPPYAEQKLIVEHLTDATSDIAEALDRARQEIFLLREYRTRLIADVVTGKLDVREAAARLPNEIDDLESIDDADMLNDSADVTSDGLDAVPDEDEA